MMKRKLIFKAITLSLLTILSGCFNNFTYVAGGEDKKGFVDGFAKDANFKYPSKMNVDEETGNLYVLDQNNTVIRKISTDGKVSTIFDISKYQNDFGIENKSTITDIRVNKDYLYFSTTNFISRIKTNGEGSYTKFLGKEIALDEKIKKISNYKLEEEILETVSFFNIRGFCFDDKNNLLVADTFKIRKIDLENKKVYDLKLGYLAGISNESRLINDSIYAIDFNNKYKYLSIIYSRNGLNSYIKNIYDDSNLQLFINKPFIISNISDFEGNNYVISLKNNSLFEEGYLLKVNNKNEATKIGLINEITSNFYWYKQSDSFDFKEMHMAINKKNKILYLSIKEDNKIFMTKFY